MRTCLLVLFLAACVAETNPSLLDDPSLPLCPDEDACVAACADRGHERGVCGWTFGHAVCVCDAFPCDADACYVTDPGERVCGVTPEGGYAQACAE